jgi:HK97 family phage portal protein
MRLFGLTITRAKAAPTNLTPVPVGGQRGWFPVVVRDPYPGAWQRNNEIVLEDWLSYWPVYRCIELISSDIAKMRLKLVERDAFGVWNEIETPAFSPVLRRPNHFQNRIQFFTSWVQSKLIHGNTYGLKQRDQRGVVTDIYVLDPRRVQTLLAPNGDVYYSLQMDQLAGVPQDGVVVPAREIIHDRMDTFYSPLIGLSKMYAAGLAALQGLKIQDNSAAFFANGSNPGGVLTAPGAISDDSAKRLKEYFEENFSGSNAGKTAVLGDGLKYDPMAVKAVDAQLLEQLKFSAEMVCGVFGVPPYKLGLGQMPTNNNVEAMDQQYYSQCLQIYIESIELALDEGLELPKGYGTEFDLDDLLRMDTATLIKAEADAVKAGIKAPNEARLRLNLGPVPGGESPYLQQQNFSLAALERRDATDNPFSAATSVTSSAPAQGEDKTAAFELAWQRGKAPERLRAYAA